MVAGVDSAPGSPKVQSKNGQFAPAEIGDERVVEAVVDRLAWAGIARSAIALATLSLLRCSISVTELSFSSAGARSARCRRPGR